MVDRFEVSLDLDEYAKSIFLFIDLIGFKEFVLQKGFSEIVSMFNSIKDEVSDGKIVFDGVNLIFKPVFNVFSDTIVISIPVGDVKQQIKSIRDAAIMSGVNPPDNLEEIYRQEALKYVFEKVSELQCSLLNHGLLSRGSVVVNNIYHNKGIWFGPAIIEGYFYESKCAVYPRVVLSETALDFFNIKNDTASSLYKTDMDGMRYIDYFSLIEDKSSVDVARELLLSSIESLREKNKIYEIQKWYWFGSKLANKLGKALSFKNHNS